MLIKITQKTATFYWKFNLYPKRKQKNLKIYPHFYVLRVRNFNLKMFFNKRVALAKKQRNYFCNLFVLFNILKSGAFLKEMRLF